MLYHIIVKRSVSRSHQGRNNFSYIMLAAILQVTDTLYINFGSILRYR